MSGADSASNITRDAYRLFEQWLDLDESTRADLLVRVRQEQPDVYTRISALIQADRAAEQASFMTGQIADAAKYTDDEDAPDRAGQQIGNWRLIRILGTGGMGQVWLAQRSDGLHQGQAAIKMLRVAISDGRANARFAQEGRILARLVHPHIAMLLDAGVTATGERYLVIEYVDGERIDAWCDERRLGIDDRLALFLQVCSAVNYAHGNLVIHRDLKPSNILVLKNGDAKLLDFGIAKLLEVDADNASQLTGELGAALTPAYAAPEQINGGAITTATDVYALGAVLHLLLGGCGPYDTTSTPMRLVRAVVETEPRRLSDLGDAETARSTASARGTTPDRLARALRDDLEVIVNKALKKNAAERYPNVQALADDVQKHLDHLPISARADSAAYRVGKFVRRHWIGVAAFTTVALAIVIGLTVAIWQANRAEREAARAVAVERFLLDMFEQARTDTQKAGLQVREATINSMLTAAAANVERSFASQPDIRDEVFETLSSLYSDSFTPDVAIDLARRRLADATSAFGSNDARTVPAEIGLANALLTSGDDKEATALLSQAQALLDRDGDATSLIRARLLRWQGILVMVHGEKPPWQQHPLRQSIELLRDRYSNDDELIEALVTLPSEACRYGHIDEAISGADELSRISVARYGADNIYTDSADLLHGQLLVAGGDARTAIPLLENALAGFKRHLGEKNQNVLLSQLDLSEAYWLVGRQDDSRAIFANAEKAAARDHAGEKQVEAMLKSTRDNIATLAAGNKLHRCES